MTASYALAFMLLQAAPPADTPPSTPPSPHAMPGEEPVDPYVASDAHAGAKPFAGTAMADAFHGQAGIKRIVETFATLNYEDKVIGEIFESHDRARFTRTVFEQFCYILNAGCSYSGRDMASSHKDLGSQQADMNRLVENLQKAMQAEGVAFAAQNRFLAKLAPMRKNIVGK